MDKINFQDGVTKVSAETFNLFQENIEKAIQAMIQAETPIGHIRMETTSVNPSAYLGFGTWELWGKGKVPVGVDSGDSDFNTVEKTGGSKVHSHDSGTLKAGFNMFYTSNPSRVYMDFNSTINDVTFKENRRAFLGGSDVGLDTISHDENSTEGLGVFGKTSDSSNVQPYITCYMWKRIS